MKRLTMMDNGFLQSETRESPMHVAGLQIFHLPKGVDRAEFFEEIAETMGKMSSTTAPFNQRLHYPPLKLGLPSWVPDEDFDVDYHLRLSALPTPGSNDQLMTLIARLHGSLLDQTRPLWECHVIEGLEGDQFAVYFKIHHACMDGMGGMDVMKAVLSKSPKAHTAKPIGQPIPKKKSPPKPKLSLIEKLKKGGTMLWGALITIPKFFLAIFKLRAERNLPEMPVVPNWYTAPDSALNVRITAQRRFATNSFPISEIKEISKKMGVTINDVALAMCSGAIRLYLQKFHQLPTKSLNVSVPVSIRLEGSGEGNAITTLICPLGTHLDNPLERLQLINQSTKQGKQNLQTFTKEAIITKTILEAMPAFAGWMLKQAHRVPLPFNVVISNVPASREPLYLNGAEMDDFYAVSLIYDMQALNITLTSYVDTLDFGLISCRRAIPELNSLASYLDDAFQELKAAANVGKSAKKKQKVKA